MQNRYLTKSRFKQALECVSKLFYTGKMSVYADKNLDDEFLLALAKGGYQVGELAKYYFCEDPANESITIDTLDYEAAVTETKRRLKLPGRVVIAEAAFRYKNLFIRVDLLVREDNLIKIYEVKAKSFDQEERFLNAKGTAVMSKWVEYLYDIAFQRYVITNALAGHDFKIKTHLILVNKDATTDIDGLLQFFKVYSNAGRIKIISKDGLQRKDLGAQILIPVPVDEICDKIETEFPVPTDLIENISFEDFVWKTADIYTNDVQTTTPLGSKCKACQFYTDEDDPVHMRDGFIECWQKAIGSDKIEMELVTELWNGLAGPRNFTSELVKKNKHFIHEIEESDIIPSGKSTSILPGLTPHSRRMEQVNRVKQNERESYFDAEGLKREMDTWTFPLHMIDFETSAVAVPFFKGMKPYEGVAFQFSHHIIDKDYNVRHETQFLSFEPGTFPNFEFVRQLKNALKKDNGSVFRYHNHENTFLNMIYWQLNSSKDAPADKKELMSFIDTITHEKSRNHSGPRDMIDLYKLVLQYYYSPAAKGSNSLKQILPAIIAESDYLKSKYGKAGVYGKNKEVRSLNFDDHVWITPETNYNPYKTLPRVFDDYDQDTLDLLVKDMDELADGGTAMTAYNYLQFSEIPVEQRKSIHDSLLRYCELDTLAMVMLLEGWRAKMQ
ncbi:MAG TPA: DUF2779 domain-containing protein [Bacteroidia bacterium]|nr:DUF2779 domain-containing protein [Bacteroidia bacterium]